MEKPRFLKPLAALALFSACLAAAGYAATEVKKKKAAESRYRFKMEGPRQVYRFDASGRPVVPETPKKKKKPQKKRPATEPAPPSDAQP